MAESENHIRRVPKWLKNVQRNSWEPEILLSGLVLIGLFQLPARIRDFSIFFAAEVSVNSWAGLFFALQLAVYFLIAGLSIHLFLRSVWVGFIGLSYTFPKGIQSQKLKYKSKFRSRIENIPALELQIIKLEKVCSSIFAICFFLMMVIIGMVWAVLVFILFIYGLGWMIEYLTGWDFINWFNPYFDLFLSWVVIIFSIDFLGLGVFRRSKYFAKVFYPFHRLIGWMTLSRIYRPVYYLFASNVPKGYVVSFLFLFLFSTIIGQKILEKRPEQSFFSKIFFFENEAGLYLFPGYYADRNEAFESQILEIPNPILKGRFLELTLKNRVSYDRLIFDNCGVKLEDMDAYKKLECVNDFFEVIVDGKSILNMDWMFYFRPEDSRKAFITYIDTEGLDMGKHSLSVRLNTEGGQVLGTVIFYKE
ncbi:hypothetical protein [Indibacter alkaliphilus]|uniref:hypothetical protein n=1 Tax=Indibacter alkaliphilus TaxID=579922 RepID=UPI0002821F0C|nr:hypothetical protein [Indibacter alkaliphilus]